VSTSCLATARQGSLLILFSLGVRYDKAPILFNDIKNNNQWYLQGANLQWSLVLMDVRQYFEKQYTVEHFIFPALFPRVLAVQFRASSIFSHPCLVLQWNSGLTSNCACLKTNYLSIFFLMFLFCFYLMIRYVVFPWCRTYVFYQFLQWRNVRTATDRLLTLPAQTCIAFTPFNH
jgi:hypothetical protein